MRWAVCVETYNKNELVHTNRHCLTGTNTPNKGQTICCWQEFHYTSGVSSLSSLFDLLTINSVINQRFQMFKRSINLAVNLKTVWHNICACLCSQLSFENSSLRSFHAVVQKALVMNWTPSRDGWSEPLIIPRDVTQTAPLKSPVTVMSNRLWNVWT